MKLNRQLPIEDRKMLNRIFWRSFFGQASRVGGQARQHAIGFLYAILPALNRYYSNDSDKKKNALVRHVQFYNVTTMLSTLVLGIIASMEKENSEVEDFDENSIVAIKVALMGPLSGIGDSIFIGVVRVIAAGVGIGLSLNGSILGPIVFLLIYNVPSIILRYYLTFVGYISGSEFITNMYKTGSMKVLTKAASILGLIMVGAMTAATVTFSSAIQIPVQNADPVKLQTYLDAILLGLVPLSLTLGCKKLLDKNVNVNFIMIGVVVLAILLAVLRVV